MHITDTKSLLKARRRHELKLSLRTCSLIVGMVLYDFLYSRSILRLE